jgi:glutathione S-transferase
MYKLYGHQRSGSCAIEMTLAELGVPYTFHEVSLDSNAQRETEYANINPQRKLPALVCPDGNVITESVAIILWLLETHPDNQLMSAPGQPDRGQALRWLVFIATEIYPIIEINDYPERFSPEDTDPELIRSKAREIWRQRWLVVEENISGPYLLSSGFCIADIYISVVSRWAQQENWRPDHIPRVEALTHQVATRPRCAEVWSRNFSSP